MNRSRLLEPPGRSTLRRLVVSLLLLGSLSVAQACAARTHAIRGTVTIVEPARIEIQHKSGQRVSVGLSSVTTFRWDQSLATLKDVLVGGRVAVLVQEPRGPFTATEVRIFSQPRTQPKPRRFESPRSPALRAPVNAHQE